MDCLYGYVFNAMIFKLENILLSQKDRYKSSFSQEEINEASKINVQKVKNIFGEGSE